MSSASEYAERLLMQTNHAEHSTRPVTPTSTYDDSHPTSPPSFTYNRDYDDDNIMEMSDGDYYDDNYDGDYYDDMDVTNTSTQNMSSASEYAAQLLEQADSVEQSTRRVTSTQSDDDSRPSSSLPLIHEDYDDEEATDMPKTSNQSMSSASEYAARLLAQADQVEQSTRRLITSTVSKDETKPMTPPPPPPTDDDDDDEDVLEPEIPASPHSVSSVRSHAEHAARLLAKVEQAQNSTRRITSNPIDGVKSTSSVTSSLCSINEGGNSPSSSVKGTTPAPPMEPYKLQFLQAQRAMVSSQEASRMRYERLEREMLALKKQREEESITVQKLEITVKQLTMELTTSNEELDKQIQLRRAAQNQRNQISEDLAITLETEKERRRALKKLMRKNEALKKILKDQVKQRQSQLKKQYEADEKQHPVNEEYGPLPLAGGGTEEELFWV